MISTLITNSPEVQAFTQALTMTLLHFLWQGLVIAGVLKIALSLISVQRSRLRYGLSCLAMGVNLLLPIATFNYLFQPSNSSILSPTNSMPIAQFQHVLQQQHGVTWYSQSLDYLPYLSVAWFVCVLFLTSKLLIEVTTTGRLARNQTIPTDPKLLARFSELAAQIGLNHTPRLVISLKAQVPMAIGWLKPVVLMPAQMLMGLNQAQLEMLLLHELAHIRRYDYLVNFLQTLIEILLFFHPAVIWVSKQMRQEREYCTDDIAVAHCGNAVAYAHTLADTASLCQSHHCQNHRHETIPAMAVAASGGDLKARVVRLVDHSCTNEQAPGRLLAALVIIGSLLVLSIKQLVNSPLLEISGLKVAAFSDSYGQSSGYNSHQQSFNDATLKQDSIAGHLLADHLLALPSWSAKTELNLQQDKNQEQSLFASAPKMEKEQQNDQQSKDATASLLREHALSEIALASPRKEQKEQKSLASEELPSANPNIKTAATHLNIDANTNIDVNANAYGQQRVESSEINKSSAPATALLASTSIRSDGEQNPLAQSSVINENDSIGTTENSLANDDSEHVTLAKIVPTLSSPHQSLFEAPVSKVSLFEQRYQRTPTPQSDVIQNLAPAKLMNAIDPRYPSVAKRKGIELDVQVNFTIDEFGRVTDIEFEQQSKLSYFRSAIISAIEQWRFEPARANGEPVDSKMSKIFSFSMS
ncbi:M56 family metallopeptidase [Thalassotalea euphylliae]|uniref:M56 family peptidase n=1 Tax=Thalassotalea euphylliae TaxID=1655234 RepID=A0A3E0UMX7_9GAMM|nr:M56 family metallopeptidase [Thalassotalea euphylliae]REL37042.1 M56 family peptidase [Thalassotalea euphylliae]